MQFDRVTDRIGAEVSLVDLADVDDERNLGGEHQAVIVLDSENYRTKGRDPVPWQHDATHIFGARVAAGRGKPDAQTRMTASEHPVIATHPVSGRRALLPEPTR